MSKYRLFLILYAIALLICLNILSACGSQETAEVNTFSEDVQKNEIAVSPNASSHSNLSPELTPEAKLKPTPESSPNPTSKPTPEQISMPESEESPINQLSATQCNSINMLNYLTVLVQKVNSSANSRMFLESAYSELINNTEPSIVDDLTLDEYEKILDLIEQYRMITVKRERLHYIYEQNSASALQSAIPDPLALLNVVQSGNPLKTIVSVAYLAIDSVSSYISYTKGLDIQYLQDGWSLDDEEAANLHDSRTSMFSYMVRISRDLPRGLTLNEDSVADFVTWSNEINVTSKIRWLESNQNTYKYYGEYWLVLAESYYDAGKYSECLDAIDTYESLDNSIFRKDIRFAQALPKAIVAAGEALSAKEYETTAARYINLILDNTYNSDWSLRYYAAQTLVDLYSKTNNKQYLSQAFEIVYDNVNELAKNQEPLNDAYLAEVNLKSTKNLSKEEKEEVKSYNELLEKTRETELPPIYEPLRLNCDLLFALANELNISSSRKADIDNILHHNGQLLFLNAYVDNAYRFTLPAGSFFANDLDVSFNGDTLLLPASILSDTATIVADVKGGNAIETIDDWIIQKVDRKKSNNIDDFIAIYKSPSLRKYSYSDGSLITITIYPLGNNDNTIVQPIEFKFKTEEQSIVKVIKKTVFTRIFE